MPATSTQSLIDKLRELPQDKLLEIEDFVDFLRERQRRAPRDADERLREAVAAGRITPPVASRKRSSVVDAPPVAVPGTPASEIVIKDRR